MLRLRLAYSLFAAAILSLTAFPLSASAQEAPGAYKSSDLTVFFGYINVDPDYANPVLQPGKTDGPRSNGLTAGGDLNLYFGLPVAPSLEVRANLANSAGIDEHSYLVGPRVQVTMFHKFRPYADLLVGYGSIYFKTPPDPTTPSFTQDNSLVYSYGGGLDYRIAPSFQARFDYQGQSWKFDPSFAIKPSILTIGVVYQIPFHPRLSMRDRQ